MKVYDGLSELSPQIIYLLKQKFTLNWIPSLSIEN